LQIQGFEVGPFAVNTYLLWDAQTKQAAIVDPSFGSEGILSHINKEGLTLAYIINTHGHVDHVCGDGYFKANAGAPGTRPLLLIHEADVPLLQRMPEYARHYGFSVADPPQPDGFLRDGDIIPIGDLAVRVYHTPGHSPGGVCFHVGEALFSGDSLMAGSIGRTDIPGGSTPELIASIRAKLLALPDATVVYTGHGPQTTIADERAYNPFLIG